MTPKEIYERLRVDVHVNPKVLLLMVQGCPWWYVEALARGYRGAL